MILQTGGLALGEISIKSKPSSLAILIASCVDRVPKLFPSLPIT